MGLFGKKKKAAEEEAARMAEQALPASAVAGYQGAPAPAPPQTPGQVPGQAQPYADPSQWPQPGAPTQQGPAGFGGPSAAPPAADDAIWQPIHGIWLDHYAQIVKYAHQQGIQDEQSIALFAQQHYGIAVETWNAAVAGWVERMGQNMAVGQRFRQVYDAT